MKVARHKKRITLPIEKERYNKLWMIAVLSELLDEMIAKHPECS